MRRRLERLGAFLLISTCVISCRERQQVDHKPTAVAPAAETQVRIIYPAAPGSFVELAAEIRKSVVNVRSTHKVTGGPATATPAPENDNSLGSGFIIDNKGHVLTNDHIVAPAGELRVVLHDGTELPARVVGRDAKLDVALLLIEGAPPLRPAKLGDSGALQVGEWVGAFGNPFGVELKMSAGVVSSLGVTSGDVFMGADRTSLRVFLETDAVIDAGNSGGPLVNTAGEVIGINTAVESRPGRGGFAVPINLAKQIVPMLTKDGVVTRAWLGVFVHPVTSERAEALGVAEGQGALVSDVVAGSPAAKATIMAGDVILMFDGRDVNSRTLPWLASTTGVGRAIPVKVWRRGAELQLILVSEKMPE